MSNRPRMLLFALMLFFVFGAWLLPSKAQRSGPSRESGGTVPNKGKPSALKSIAPKPAAPRSRTPLPDASSPTPISVASTCAVPKATPTLVDSVARRYDSYTFTNTTAATACVTVSVTSGCSTNLYYATYLGSFNPANILTNYLADAGASFAGTATFSFNVPVGQSFVLVLHEVATTGCASYTATITGLLSGTDGGGVCVPCSISCPANVAQSNDPNQCGAIVAYPAPTTAGTCGPVACSPASGSFFPVGTTTVTCNATQGSSCTFTVKVNDVQAPVVTCNVSTTTLWPPNHDLINAGLSASATDNCPGTVISVAVFGDEDDEHQLAMATTRLTPKT